MPTSKTSPYDVIIVGAGINGCASAYFLRRAGLKVALIDQVGIAAGGSGAAGAFIAPKISKAGPLKELMEKAHAHAIAFYPEHFPDSTLLRPLLHIANTPEDAEKLSVFKNHTRLAVSEPSEALKQLLVLPVTPETSVYFDHSAIVNAQKVCREMSAGIDFYPLKVESMQYGEDMWSAAGIKGKHVLLAIGAYPKILPLPYISMRGIWGHRIDIQTDTNLPCILHHHVSISPTSKEGVMAIGATHNVHYSPLDGGEPYDIKAGRAELLDKASKTLRLNNVKIIKDFIGLRSGSNDYMPLLGPLIDAEATLALHPKIRHGQAVEPSEYVYYPNVSMINGSGGYGFVLAPYLAQILARYLTQGEPIDKELLPERFFTRWAKKSQL